MEAIDRLPAGQRAVIILRDIEGCEAEEACTLLGISAENQRVLLHRARGRIRQVIDAVTGTPRPAATTSSRRRGGVDATAVHRLAHWAHCCWRPVRGNAMIWLARAMLLS